jgi:GTPase
MRRVAIVGRPNVGKSSLFNRLMGRRVAIVHDQPGVTRDRLAGICREGAFPFELIDTGGIGSSPDPDFAEATHTAAQAAMAGSDLLLFLVDGRSGLTPVDRELARMLRSGGKPILLAVNKVDEDRHEASASEFFTLGFHDVLTISAAHGRGTTLLMERIATLLGGPDGADLPEESGAPRLAIVGRPNVGKSSLLNRLIGEERSIVSNIAGTTRDALDVRCELQGVPYVLVDTAGIRHRSRPDTSVEVFSAMRSEEAIRRADMGLLVIDAQGGVTSQDKRIAGMIQESGKACIVLLNKWDLVRKEDGGRVSQGEQAEVIRKDLFFLDFAPVVCLSARTGQHFGRLFTALKSVRKQALTRVPTAELNRFLREVLEVHPPPSKSGKRFKLLYATQVVPERERPFHPPEFLLFVNDETLITDSYREYLFNRIRERWPFPGLPIRLRLKGRETREEQDRKKEGRLARVIGEPLPESLAARPSKRRGPKPTPKRKSNAGRKRGPALSGRKSVAKRKVAKGPTGRRIAKPRKPRR